jgi:hypothetical protein
VFDEGGGGGWRKKNNRLRSVKLKTKRESTIAMAANKEHEP